MSECTTCNEDTDSDENSSRRSRSWGTSHEEFHDNYSDSEDVDESYPMEEQECEGTEDWDKKMENFVRLEDIAACSVAKAVPAIRERRQIIRLEPRRLVPAGSEGAWLDKGKERLQELEYQVKMQRRRRNNRQEAKNAVMPWPNLDDDGGSSSASEPNDQRRSPAVEAEEANMDEQDRGFIDAAVNPEDVDVDIGERTHSDAAVGPVVGQIDIGEPICRDAAVGPTPQDSSRRRRLSAKAAASPQHGDVGEGRRSCTDGEGAPELKRRLFINADLPDVQSSPRQLQKKQLRQKSADREGMSPTRRRSPSTSPPLLEVPSQVKRGPFFPHQVVFVYPSGSSTQVPNVTPQNMNMFYYYQPPATFLRSSLDWFICVGTMQLA